MVRQWQTLFYNKRYSNTDLHSHRIPDFVETGRGLRLRTGCAASNAERGRRHDREGDGDRRPPRSWWTSWSTRTRWCGRWWRPGPATTRSWSRATWRRTGTARTDAMSRHTLSVLVEDKPGVLARIAGLFSRRGFNIESLAVGPTEHAGVSRMTIVVNVEEPAARAGDQAAEQADQRAQDRRARAGRRGPARAHAGQGAGRRRDPRRTCWRPSSCSGPRWSTSRPTP